MCTLTFVPGLPSGGYLLAHNRDESRARGPGLPPTVTRLGSALVLAPRDSDAGGTWLGVDEHGRCLAILNGDRPPAASPPTDARSRGLLVAALLADARADAVQAALERDVAAGILRSRPFKLVIAEPGAQAEARLRRIDWDGARLRVSESAGAQCLVSSTFEVDAVAAARHEAFARWLDTLPRELGTASLSRGTSVPGESGDQVRADALLAGARAFHAGHAPGAPDGDAFSVCMHRADARTVSRTLLLVGPRELRMEYTAGWPCEGAAAAVSTLARTALPSSA